MTIGVCPKRIQHVNHERDWVPSTDDNIALSKRVEPDEGWSTDAFEAANSWRKLTRVAIDRHADKDTKNLDRLDLSQEEHASYRSDAGVLTRLGEQLGNISLWSARAFAETQPEKSSLRVTLELLGKATCDLAEVECFNGVVPAIESQFERRSLDWVMRPFEASRRTPSFKFFPYFSNPDEGDFSFTDGWLQMREPLANGKIEDGPPLNIFRQREVTVYLPRSDEETRAAVEPLSAQGWQHDGIDKTSYVADVVARNAYDRFMAGDDPTRSMVLMREQILVSAFMHVA